MARRWRNQLQRLLLLSTWTWKRALDTVTGDDSVAEQKSYHHHHHHHHPQEEGKARMQQPQQKPQLALGTVIRGDWGMRWGRKLKRNQLEWHRQFLASRWSALDAAVVR